MRLVHRLIEIGCYILLAIWLVAMYFVNPDNSMRKLYETK